eukprot:263897_1
MPRTYVPHPAVVESHTKDCVLQYSVTGRALCPTCSQLISLGSIRCRKAKLKNTWYHPQCFKHTYPAAKLNAFQKYRLKDGDSKMLEKLFYFPASELSLSQLLNRTLPGRKSSRTNTTTVVKSGTPTVVSNGTHTPSPTVVLNGNHTPTVMSSGTHIPTVMSSGTHTPTVVASRTNTPTVTLTSVVPSRSMDVFDMDFPSEASEPSATVVRPSKCKANIPTKKVVKRRRVSNSDECVYQCRSFKDEPHRMSLRRTKHRNARSISSTCHSQIKTLPRSSPPGLKPSPIPRPSIPARRGRSPQILGMSRLGRRRSMGQAGGITKMKAHSSPAVHTTVWSPLLNSPKSASVDMSLPVDLLSDVRYIPLTRPLPEIRLGFVPGIRPDPTQDPESSQTEPSSSIGHWDGLEPNQLASAPVSAKPKPVSPLVTRQLYHSSHMSRTNTPLASPLSCAQVTRSPSHSRLRTNAPLPSLPCAPATRPPSHSRLGTNARLSEPSLDDYMSEDSLSDIESVSSDFDQRTSPLESDIVVSPKTVCVVPSCALTRNDVLSRISNESDAQLQFTCAHISSEKHPSGIISEANIGQFNSLP